MYNNIPGPEQIRIFLEQLLAEAGITPVPDLKESMIADLEDRLSVHLVQTIAPKLTPADFEQFTEISGSDPVDGQVFLQSKINNLPEVYLEALDSFRQMFLAK
jgi:hypothetical protein